MGLDIEFDKKCLVGLSPTTVLPPINRRFSNVESRSSRRSKFTRRDELLTIDENFTEINFVKYRSASCKDDVSSHMKRGSVYQSSNEVRQMKKMGVFEERREKIEIPHGVNEEILKKKKKRSSVHSRNSGLSKSLISESLMDNFASDEFFEIRLKGDECVERESNVDQNMRCSEVCAPQNDANELPEVLPKSLSSRAFQNHRFRPIRKMFDPFTKSKSFRSPLGVSYSESKLKPESLNMKKTNHSVAMCSPVHLNGHLKVEKKHGTPFFEFTLKSPDEVFVAKTRKVDNSYSWVYTFYSISSRRHKEALVVGQMKVSCYLNSEQNDETFDSSVMVNEFVLYDISHVRKCFVDEERCDISQIDLSPSHEIAAIVIEAPFEKRESLKNKNKSDRVNDTFVKVLPTRTNVVIPSGIHAFVAKEDNHGPSCLLDRWRLNGECECGGWDMGCPLTIFCDATIQSEVDCVLTKNPWPLEIHLQGKKEKEPSLRMSFSEEGNYSVDFHAQLSTLQAFSICVAILHNLDPSSVVKLEENKRLLQCISLKELLIKDEVKFLVTDEEKKEMLPSFVPNPPFSPIARV